MPEAVTSLPATWDTKLQKVRDALDGKPSFSLQAREVELTKDRALDQSGDVLAFRFLSAFRAAFSPA